MRKFVSVFLVLLFSFSLSVLVLIINILFVGKLFFLLLIHAGVFFYTRFYFDQQFKGQENKIRELNFQLEEKRIQLREQDSMFIKQEEKTESGQSFFNSEELNQEIKNLYDSYKNFAHNYSQFLEIRKNSQDGFQKELQDVEANYHLIEDNIKKTFDISDNLSVSAKKAFIVAEDVQKGILRVTNSLGNAIGSSDALYNQSQKISRIIEIIREIADKTHVLSINASIVSARAGIHGKAFDVVAREIRNLASESEGSIQEIENEVNEIQNTISEMVDKIQNANKEIIAEKELLVSVVGKLQGITLGVEVLRAVSKVANEKSLNQNEIVTKVINRYRNLIDKWDQFGIEHKGVNLDELEKLLISHPEVSVESGTDELT